MMEDELIEEEHEIDAYYAFNGSRRLHVLACSCGYAAMLYSWEAAGSAMDIHLQEVKDGTHHTFND